MAKLCKLFVTHWLILCMLVSSSSTMARVMKIDSKASLKAWMKLEDDNEDSSNACWDSLFELQACTGEVILFFMNGETYLGPSCCRAIETIEHHCWPSMLDTVGITSEEADILRGYCDERNSTAILDHQRQQPSLSPNY